jgi:hypothetical protein
MASRRGGLALRRGEFELGDGGQISLVAVAKIHRSTFAAPVVSYGSAWDPAFAMEQDAQGWVPTIWHKEPGEGMAVIWDSTQIHHWTASNRDNFCPYVWLGAEQRGLCWFGDDELGYVNDGRQPVQTLRREGGKVVLRVWIIQQPTPSDHPRRIRFGLPPYAAGERHLRRRRRTP